MTIAVVLFVLSAGLAITQGVLDSRANPSNRVPLWGRAPHRTRATRWLPLVAIASATLAAGLATPRLNFGVGIVIALACINVPVIVTAMWHNQRLRHRSHGQTGAPQGQPPRESF